ncbi:type II toxin-antitoxin system HicB family antitoxin [Tritonibacter mobilis]|uniref:type II toxin-antitoxin system HicB family antitoxin n=1 Tax=Tritonibacter mobilis TaxID=379347 RepID=UPI000806AE08|nr:type II toxin-antitoxin system HicB family antitoxin [Tritonibacter mobilis]
MAEYVAVIRKAEGTDYWIDLPDIPGCVSRGTTEAAARDNLKEALAQHIAKTGLPAKAPRPADQLTQEELEDAVETCIIEL